MITLGEMSYPFLTLCSIVVKGLADSLNRKVGGLLNVAHHRSSIPNSHCLIRRRGLSRLGFSGGTMRPSVPLSRRPFLGSWDSRFFSLQA